MQVVCCQLDVAWHDATANVATVRVMLAADRPQDGALIVLPEMFASGFTMDVSAAADRSVEPFLAELAKEHQSHVIAGVASIGPDGRGRNQAVAFDPAGSEIARFTKLHAFTPAGEHERYTSGDDVVCFPCGEFFASPLICYDLRFGEAFRLATARGATLLVVIANWPAQRHAHWRALLVARAIENQAYVIGVNRSGSDPNHAYAGGSIVIGPAGEVIAEANESPCVLSAQIDPTAIAAARKSFPVLKDIRPDLQ